jgi:maleylpyruvate isomerase
MYSSPRQRSEEIEFGATLPVQALRNLSDHAAVHLDVEWRDLEDDAWGNTVRTALGRTVPASETVWMRTREVWLHAIDLDNGGRFEHLPAELLGRLLTDVTSAWAKRRGAEDIPAFVLDSGDERYRVAAEPEPDEVVLRGSAASLVRWATGRGMVGVLAADGASPPVAPRWL